MTAFKYGVKASLALFALSVVTLSGAAAQGNFEITKYRFETEDCPGCGAHDFSTEDEVRDYVSSIRNFLEESYGNRSRNYHGPFRYGYYGYPYWWYHDVQTVFLDFDAGGDPTFPVCMDNGDGTSSLFGVFQDHYYTPEERDEIHYRIAKDYAQFGYRFVQRRPREGTEFSTISFGQNDAPEDCSEGSNITVTPTGGVSILFGRADKIDFLNQDPSDNAFADANFWEFLAQLDPSGATFERLSGLSLGDFSGNLTLAVSEAVVNQSSNTGAHEAGHIQGLRHQNSFGAPGDGLPDTGAISPNDFVPVFDGPIDASETVLHTMASGASVGLSLQGSTITDRFFSERSAARLAIAERGSITTEDKIRDRPWWWLEDFFSLRWIYVPNTIVEGENQDARLRVRARVIEGDIDAEGEVDSYVFLGLKGEFFNAELISVIGEELTFEEGIIGQLHLYQINYDGTETLIASNQQSFETVFDAEIFDAVLPKTGFYRVEVTAPDEFFPADFDGDGVLDPFPLSDAGAPELTTGKYSLQLFTCVKKLRPRRHHNYVVASYGGR